MLERRWQMAKSTFLSYSHADAKSADELKKHIKPLIRSGLIELWSDHEIIAGQDIDIEIDGKLSTADIVLLLLSPDFIASDYCYSIEMQKAIDRHARGDVKIIPIILRLCQWLDTPISRLRATPTNANAILSRYWDDKDEAWNEVATDIKRAAQYQKSAAADSKSEEVTRISNQLEGIIEEEEPDNEYGFIDYQISFEENIAASTNIITEINGEIQDLGPAVGETATKLTSLGPNASSHDKKLVINEIATLMDGTANFIGERVPELRAKTLSSLDSIFKAIRMIKENDESNAELDAAAEKFYHTLQDILSSIAVAKEGTLGFRAAVFNLPAATKEVRKSKNNLIKSLDAFVDYMEEVAGKASTFDF